MVDELMAMSFYTRRGNRVHEVRLQIGRPGETAVRAGLDPSQRRELAAFLLDGLEAP